MKWTIAKKLIAGFSGVALILLITVILGIIGLQKNKRLVNQVTELRSPTAQASLQVLNGVNQSLAGLRGWMLLNNEKFKTDRATAWEESIDAGLNKMTALSKNWTNPENVERLNNLKNSVEKFRKFQQEIEDKANTDENIPAYDMLLTYAAPKASIMSTKITEMIDIELKRDANDTRKSVLGMMADVRGTLGLGLANIRAYLLTGDEDFSQKFMKLWEKNERRFGDLSRNYGNLNQEQQQAFNALKKAREEFVTYPKQMFALRGAEDWNIANHWLKTKAAPIAGEITATLNKMVINQNKLLQTDNVALADLSKTMTTSSLILVVVGLLLAFIITFLIVRSVTQPLAKMNDSLQSIASGDLTISIDTKGSDEIATAMKSMQQMTAKLKEVISSVISASDNIADASSEMTGSSQQMSEGATEQASAAEEISSSMEQMAANIQQNTDNSKQTEKIAQKAAVDIEESSNSVNDSVSSMKTIAEKISIIGEIARQTNLLALNAAVEAARAGEHGKGFAVVAAEVRKLAERSQSAATEINELSSSSVSISEKSGQLLESIVPDIRKTSDLVQEISASSVEQNSGADQVNNAIQQLNQVVQQNAATAEELAASSEELNSQADYMKDLMNYFKVDEKGATKLVKKKVAIPTYSEEISKKRATPFSGKSNGVHLEMDMEGGSDSIDKGFEKF